MDKQGRSCLLTIALLLSTLLFGGICAQRALALDPKDTPAARVPSADPYVLLDAAKMTLADGRLEDAAVQLAAIPLGKAEPYVDEEILVQRLLISGAFLTADSYVASQVVNAGEGSGAYCKWLKDEAQKHGADFAQLAQQYLDLTANGYYCTFIRFRLPQVTEEHLQDVQLYTDPQILGPASKNWEEGRDTLGRGVALSQARVALVLAAASNYDLKEASSTIMGVARRLSAGVPLRPSTMLDWLAQTAAQHAVPGTPLAAVEAQLETRLAGYSNQPWGAEYAKRAQQRQQIMARNEQNLLHPPPLPPRPPALEPPLEAPAAGGDKLELGKKGEALPVEPKGPAEGTDAPPAENGDVSTKPEDGSDNVPPAAGEAEKPKDGGGEKEKDHKRPHGRPIPRQPRSDEAPAAPDSNNTDGGAS